MKNEPYFLLNKKTAILQYQKMKELADKVSYSLKTNYEVGKVLEAETESQFSVHSIQALKLLEGKDRAWFFAQGWDACDVKEIVELGAVNFVVDNEADLKVLLDNCTKKINLLLRMRLKEHTVHTGKHFVFGMYSHKINELIPELRKDSRIDKLGIHFHRKTQNVSEWNIKEELNTKIPAEVLEMLDIVNIGGGLPAKYKNFREEVYEYIFKEISKLKEWLNSKEIEMIIEPGRIIAAPSVKLKATIINKYDNNIVINCAVYNAAMDSFIVHNRLLVEGELDKGQSYTIKGCTPDSLDIFRYSVYLAEPKVGDMITFLNAGAYNFSSDFCKLPKIKTVIE